MAAKNTKQMTFDEAVNLLQGDIFTCSQEQIDNAIDVISKQDPNHPILKRVENLQDNQEDKEAKNYFENIECFQSLLDAYDFKTFVSDNADVQPYINAIDLTERTNSGNKILTPERKEEYLMMLYEAAKIKAQASLSISANYSKLPKHLQEQLIKEEIKNTFVADFARVAIAPYIEMPSKKEAKLATIENKKYIIRQVHNAANAFKDFITNKKKIIVNTDHILASCADSVSQVESHINKLRKKAKKTKLSAKQNFNSVADYFSLKIHTFEKFANRISQNKYEIWKSIKGSFKDNKIKLIGNISASTAFGLVTAGIAAGTIGAPMTAAVGAYAAYHAAGSWVYPIIAEMRKINRLRKEKNKIPLKLKEQFKQAWKNKTSKDEKTNSAKARNTYIVNGVINTSLAAIGFGCLKNGLEAIDEVRTLTDGVSDGINVDLANSIAETKHAVSMGRIAIPLAGQLTDAAVTYGISLADPENKEKAEEAKQTAVAALVGVGFSAMAQGIGFALASDNTQDVSENLTEAGTQNIPTEETATIKTDSVGLFSRFKNFIGLNSNNSTEVSVQTDTSLQGIHVAVTTEQDNLPLVDNSTELTSNTELLSTDASNADMSNNSVQTSLFPKEYNENMGISQKQYNILVSTTEGTLKSATGEEITLDRAYLNLNDDVMQNFPNQTKEEVLYKFNRLYAFMRKAYEVGDGTLRETPSGIDYLEGRFENMNLNLSDSEMTNLVRFAQENTYDSAQELREGLNQMFPDKFSDRALTSIITTIHSNQRFYQYTEEMEALIKLLGCGEEITAQEAAKINVMLEQTDNIIATGKSNTVFTGLNLSKGCLDDDGQWMKVSVEPAPQVEPAPIKEDPIKVAPLSVPINVPQGEIIPTEPMPTQEVVVTKFVTEDVRGGDNYDYAEKSKIIGGSRANHLAEIAEENGTATTVEKVVAEPIITTEPVATNETHSNEIVVKKSVSSKVSGISNPEQADESKTIDGARARRLARRAARD